MSGTFLVYAAIFAVFVTPAPRCCAIRRRTGNPPAGPRPRPAATAADVAPDFTQGRTVRTPAFWMLWLAFMFASGCGLMVIGSLKDFGIREGGLSDAEAEGALGLLALFNAAGRIVWGSVSQRLGAAADAGADFAAASGDGSCR